MKQQTSAPMATDIQASFHFLYPLHEFLRTRRLFENVGGAQKDVSNRLVHDRRLLDHRARRVTTPNTDTLYSRAWLSLRDRELRLAMPDFGQRYYSAAFMDCHTDHFAYVGSRTHGPGAHEVVIIGPGANLKDAVERHPGLEVVQSPSNDVWMLVRILVDSGEDLPAVHALQDAMSLTGSEPELMGCVQAVANERDLGAFLALCAEGYRRNDNTAIPAPIADALRTAGVDLGLASPLEGMAPEQLQAWDQAYPGLLSGLKRPPHKNAPAGSHGGPWTTGLPHIGKFGDDYGYRAHVARVGLGALEKAEASYTSCGVDDAGERLQAGRSYRLDIPGPVPVDAFWSLTMYELDDMGRRFFTENPIGRYAIGDRTPGLASGPSGEVSIHISADMPDDSANWLPAPREGMFALTMRYYIPRDAILRGEYRLPAPRRID